MKTTLLGIVALSAGLVMLAMSATAGGGLVQAGSSPTATPDPTIDPCDEFKGQPPPTCTVQPTQPPRSEEQDTPTPSATTETTEVPQTPLATNTAPPQPPPPSTATPGGGAGAGGVSPPDTGAGAGQKSSDWASWPLALGAVLAIGGLAAVTSGAARRRR